MANNNDDIALKVELKEGDGAEWAIKKFSRLCQKCGILGVYRAKKHYRKPSIELKEKTEKALKRRLKDDRRRKSRGKI